MTKSRPEISRGASRTFLIFYLLGLVGAVVLFLGGAFLVDRQVVARQEKIFNEQQALQTNLAARVLEDHLKSAAWLVGRAAEQDPALDSSAYATVFLQRVLGSSRDLKALAFLDREARVQALVSTQGEGGQLGLRQVEEWGRRHLAEVAAGPGPFATPFYLTARDQLAGLLIPVRRRDEFVGFLSAAVDLSALIQRYIAPMRSGRWGAAFLLDENGTVLYDHETQIIGRNIFDGLHADYPDLTRLDRLMVSQPMGTGDYHFTVRRGGPVSRKLIAWHAVEFFGRKLIVAMSAPDREIEVMLTEFRRQRVLLGVFLTLAILGAGLFFHRRRERKRLEADEEKYRTLVEGINAIVFATDETGQVTYVSPEVETVGPYRPGEIIGRNFLEFVYEQDRPRTAAAFGLALTGDRGTTETRFYDASGKAKWFRIISRPVFREGRPAGTRGLLVDVTEQKRAEEELDLQNKRFESLIRNTDLAIAVLDEAHMILSCNRAFEKTFLVREEQIVGRNIDELVAGPGGLDEARGLTGQILRGEPVHATGTRYRSDGAPFEAEIYGAPVIVEGRVVGAYGLYSDLSELKKAQSALREKEALYRTLFETASDAIFIMRDERFVDCNPTTLKMFNASREDIIGRPPYDFSPKVQPDGRESREAARAYIRAALEGQPQFFEWRHRRLDGLPFDAEVSLNRMDLAEGPFLLAAVRDVTVRKQAERALRLSEEKYRTILESTGDGYYEVDLKGRFTFINESFRRILGYSRDELLGADYRRFCEPGQAESIFRSFNQVFQTGQPVRDLVWSISDGEGRKKHLEVMVYLRRDEEGRALGFRGLIRDITDRRRAEEALRWSEEKYKALYDNALVGMFRVSIEDGTALEINDVCVKMFGYDSKEEVRDKLRTLDHYVDPEERRGAVETLLREGRVDSMVVQFRRRDGSPFWAEYSAKIYPKEGYVEGTVIDVTDRVKAGLALQESERRYRRLFDTIHDLILTHDLAGRLIEVNPAVCQAFGYPREEIIGRSLMDFVVPEYRDQFEEAYLEPMKREGYREGVFQVADREGQVHYVEYRATLVQAAGQPPYVTGSGRDVTERIRAQRELREMEEQLSQSMKMEAVGTLASGISHDFNNILQAISGYIQLLQARTDRGDPGRRYLMEMDQAIERAADLVRRLLTFSRKVEPELKPTDLNLEVRHAVSILERTIPKMIRIETRLAKDLWPISGDSGQLEQIVMNLGTNARDAMPEGGRLLVETENFVADEEFCRSVLDVEPGRWVQLRVTDTGCGMDKETAGHIFEPFFTTKGSGKGTGLGLSSVYGIVKGHRGHVDCRSEPGQGAVFRVLLPALPPEAGAPAAREPLAAEVRGGNETILVVDDERPILEVAKEALESQGYKVLAADSGEKALEVYRRPGVRVDLVVLDLGMPGMGGYSCLKALLELDHEAKVIIASGYAEEGHAERTLGYGAADYLTKPYRLADLLEKVRVVLDGPGEAGDRPGA
ncbi:MAG: PAS domain S-box protein [Thermodesulfobacteriota bacterium]